MECVKQITVDIIPIVQDKQIIDGPLHFIGVNNNKYRYINSDSFLCNGRRYSIQTDTVSLDAIHKLVDNYGKRLVVKSCIRIDDTNFIIEYVIVADMHSINPWDWTYPVGD